MQYLNFFFNLFELSLSACGDDLIDYTGVLLASMSYIMRSVLRDCFYNLFTSKIALTPPFSPYDTFNDAKEHHVRILPCISSRWDEEETAYMGLSLFQSFLLLCYRGCLRFGFAGWRNRGCLGESDYKASHSFTRESLGSSNVGSWILGTRAW